MEAWLLEQINDWPLPLLLALAAGTIALLGCSADSLVKEAVVLSERSGVPKIVIGATIVSVGTTLPEAAVSVLAAMKGSPDLALGNAVGSIICDTGLILGIACLIKPLPLDPNIVNRQGWVQLGAGLLLVAWCWAGDGVLPQVAGFVFLGMLAVYLWLSTRWAKGGIDTNMLEELEDDLAKPVPLVVAKLLVAIALVVLASMVLIPTVEIIAIRLGIPKAVIAATLVAFGTSLPELVTAIAATRHGHGDLAVGNIVGADILNVLFVCGAAAAVTPAGLHASRHFFVFLFPAMIGVLVVFRIGIFVSKDRMSRAFGALLLGIYLAVTAVSFVVDGDLP